MVPQVEGSSPSRHPAVEAEGNEALGGVDPERELRNAN